MHPFTRWHHDSERVWNVAGTRRRNGSSPVPSPSFKCFPTHTRRRLPTEPVGSVGGVRRAPTAVRGNEGQRGTRDGGEQLVSIVCCQRKVLPSYCCNLIGRSCQHVCLGGTRCQWLSGPLCRQHTATHKLTMWARVTLLPARIMFPRLSRPTHCVCWMSEVFLFFSLSKNCQSALPVSYVAGVELKLIIISQQSLLHMAQVHWLAVDHYEPHTPLEGRRRDLAVHAGTSWMGTTQRFSGNSLLQCVTQKRGHLKLRGNYP